MSMSIQSDVEILSVQALEQYAKQHNLPTAEAVSLFYKHQVFEKILIQHEYLHQLDLEETLNYVEEIIAEDAPELVIYHGSNFAFDTIDLEKSHNRRDFGRGFYCTVLESQAEEWARRLYLRSHKGGTGILLYCFGKPGRGMGQTAVSALPQRRQIRLPLPVPADRGPEDQALCRSGSGVAGVYQGKPHKRRHPALLRRGGRSGCG